MQTDPPLVALSRAIGVLDGPTKAAKALGVPGYRYQTVQAWSRSRVPAEYCPAIERETAARGSPVTCEELRPDVDWSVLRTRSIPQSSAGVVPTGGTTTDQEAA
jgi:DNA-binding transcriptional regulator YdaS (Cro superfamily)